MSSTNFLSISLALSVLIAIAFYALTPSPASAHKGFRHAIIESLPDEARKELYKRMGDQKEQWHKDMAAMHKETRILAERFAVMLKNGRFDRKKADALLENMQSKLVLRGTRAMGDMRTTIIDVLAQLPPEKRREAAEELEELLEDWQEHIGYHRRQSRWWQFWR